MVINYALILAQVGRIEPPTCSFAVKKRGTCFLQMRRCLQSGDLCLLLSVPGGRDMLVGFR